MLNPFRLIAAAFHGLHLLLRPGHLPAVFGLVDTLMTEEKHARMRDHVAAHPRGAHALANPFHLDLDVDALAQLPPGTLGRAFADFMEREGITPTVLTDKALGEREWLPTHLYEVHDIWHVVCGFGTSVVEEVKILSFMLAQLPHDRMAPAAIAIAFLRGALGHPTITPAAVQAAVVEGTRIGRQADLFVGVNWAELWDRPLGEVRAMLGVEVKAVALAA